MWSYGGSIVGPIFTGGAISGQVAQAEAGQKAALSSYLLAIQNAFGDTENALVANTNLGTQLEAQGRLVTALSEYSKLARLQFDGGYTSYSTVLQAEQQLFPAELNQATIRAQLYASFVEHLPGARRRLGEQGRRAVAAADGRHADARGREGGGAGAMRACTWVP